MSADVKPGKTMPLSPKEIRDIKKVLRKVGVRHHFMRLIDYYGTVAWESLRTDAMRRDQGVCVVCGTSNNLQVHHVRYPESFCIGRDKYINIETDSIENLVTLCEGHHAERHSHQMRITLGSDRPTYIYEEESPPKEIDFRMVNFVADAPFDADGDSNEGDGDPQRTDDIW